MKFLSSLLISFAPLQQCYRPALAFSATSPPPARIPLKGIDASQFRHPLDRDLTSFVQNAPFSGVAEEAIRASLSLVEQGARLDLLSSSVKVSPDQLPELHNAMEHAAKLLDMEVVPELYVQSSSQANAFTLALQNRDSNKPPVVVVTSALLDRCSDSEVQAIIGHELGKKYFPGLVCARLSLPRAAHTASQIY